MIAGGLALHAHAPPPALFSRQWWGYWCDFLWVVPLAIVCLWSFQTGLDYLIVAGFIGWTFIEYVMHRFVLHWVFWHGNHEKHHLHPGDYVVFPLWHTPLFFAAALGLAIYLNLGGLFTGFLLGYLWFLTVHHWLHHIHEIKWAWLHRYAVWHMKHHDGRPVNYGITTKVWDRLFGTFA